LSTAGYSGTPLWKKLGVKANGSLALLDAPTGWSVAELPNGVSVTVSTAAELEARTKDAVAVAFFLDLASLHAGVRALADRIFPDGALWVAWPRRAGGHDSDIREDDIRAAALGIGLVDVKVAAIDADWSGLRLVWRRERRGAPSARPRIGFDA
jgi:hypothetical protein